MLHNGLTILSKSPEQTRSFGRAVGSLCSGGEIILLEGPLGAGKTVFVQGLALGLGIVGPVQSPSFVLERFHRGRLILRHLDLYRLTVNEAEEAGLLFEPEEDTVMAVEWADRVSGKLSPALTVRIEFSPPPVSESRTIRVSSQHALWRGRIGDVVQNFID